MQVRRAILVDGSRLMREIIRRVIENKAGFEVVLELSDLQDLNKDIQNINANWIFMVLQREQKVPDDLKAELFLKIPSLKLVGVCVDDGHVHAEWMTHQERDFTGLDLEDFVSFLIRELDESHSAFDTGGKK